MGVDSLVLGGGGYSTEGDLRAIVWPPRLKSLFLGTF